jgi:hypothetical protein
MPEFTVIIRSLSQEKFAEVVNASPRKSREVYFHRHNVKAPPSTSRMPKPGAKNEARTLALYQLLKETDDDQMSEEILRTWLLSKRPMLARALDHLGIKHDNGLTDSDDVGKFEKLSGKELKSLVKALDGVAPKEDVAVYLKFMGSQGVDEAL